MTSIISSKHSTDLKTKRHPNRPSPLLLNLQSIINNNEDNSPRAKTPVSPNNWSIRIKNPVFTALFKLTSEEVEKYRSYKVDWRELKPVEFINNIYLGACHNLHSFKYDTRVSIQDDLSLLNFIEESLNIESKKLEIIEKDDYNVNIMAHFDKVCEFLDSQPEDEIKIIHCVAGMNRSATLATAYYIYKTKTPLLDAINYMVSLRPIILRNDNFLKQLILWAFDNGFV